jgi:hypothetical protein
VVTCIAVLSVYLIFFVEWNRLPQPAVFQMQWCADIVAKMNPVALAAGAR